MKFNREDISDNEPFYALLGRAGDSSEIVRAHS